ncbi:restriction endonuclease [Arthrobacter sp. YAF16]|uniref:restriction endonuclease n=1 Tax=Arthrobacter sp. YAF16 TaxID=3233076 RepID=UPI003F8F9D1E
MRGSQQAPNDVAFEMTRYPPAAQMSASEFEEFVVATLRSLNNTVDNLEVKLHEVVEGTDGTYDMDAVMHFDVNGMTFRVLIEAKRHKNPIKREVVQILHQKVLSAGAQKGLIVATAPFQRGALDFAKAHGVALVVVSEGRFTYETRSADPAAAPSHESAARMGIPAFVGHAYRSSANGRGTQVSVISREYPEYLLEVLTEPIHL